MKGQTLGRYQIRDLIGRGGMGEVYLAHDPHLDRDVALKVLPKLAWRDVQHRRRFQREARSLSKLNHPHIATVHDFDSQDGVDFLVMEYVPGETLSDRLRSGALSESEVVGLGLQLTDGLQAAHSQGVIHRDLKPANLRVTEEGRLKILDFGLAKLMPSADESASIDATTIQSPSENTGVAGTIPYMAPEQLRGSEVTSRTDIHAVGAVLYEMITGRRRHADRQGADLIDAILNRDPDPPSSQSTTISRPLESVIMKALARDPSERYPSAADLHEDLRRVQAGRAVEEWSRPSTGRRRILCAVVLLAVIVGAVAVSQFLRPPPEIVEGPKFARVAVLPFVTSSEDSEDSEAVVQGIVETLITRLQQLNGVRTTPWQTVRSYAGSESSLQDVAAELGVEALITGSLRRYQGRTRVSVSLVSGADGLQEWSDSFESSNQDLFALEDQLATEAAENLKGELTGEERRVLTRPMSDSVEAYEFYMKGAHTLQTESAEANKRAIDYFRKAIDLDPELAEAHVGLGAALVLAFHYGWGGGQANLKQAEDAFRKALRLKPDLASAARGLLRTLPDVDGTPGGGFGTSIVEWAIDWTRDRPRTVANLFVLAQAYFLHGLEEEAIPLFHEILEQDPRNPGAQYSLVVSHAWADQYEQAIEEGKTFYRRFGPDADVFAWMAFGYHGLGKLGIARSFYERSLEIAGDSPQFYTYVFLSALHRQVGDVEASRRVAREGLDAARRKTAAYPDNWQIRGVVPSLHLLLGEEQQALREAEALQEIEPSYPWVTDLAGLYYLLGRPEECIRLLRERLEARYAAPFGTPFGALDLDQPIPGNPPIDEAHRREIRSLLDQLDQRRQEAIAQYRAMRGIEG